MSGAGKLLNFRRAPAADGAADGLSDQALLAACAIGDTGALGVLFDRYHRSVYRFLSRLRTTNPDDVDDLVQATFLELWRSPRSYRGRGAVQSWIFGIAVNVARRNLRTDSRRRKAHQSFAECPVPPSSMPDDAAEHSEMLTRLEHALRSLPHDLRVAFVLCDLEEVPGTEAASAVGVRRGTMWRRLHDARKALRAALDGRRK